MDKKEELVRVIQENPDRELVVMYSNEGNSDYAYSLGDILTIEVTETTVWNEERVYTSDEFNELLETVSEEIYFEKYHDPKKELTDAENDRLDAEARKIIENLEWKPVIVVYVG